MRIAYLDCFAGIAGDMFLGALLDAGVPPQVLHDATAALGVNATLSIETVDRSGISCTKVHVLEDGQPAGHTDQAHQHEHTGGYSQHPKTQHLHKAGHPHTTDQAHSHPHVHGRSLNKIRAMISAAPLPEPVKLTSIRSFELLGHSEAKIHNVPIEEIHFHEVGAVDAIVDIVAASAGIHHLQIGAWYCSPLNVGGGTVSCAHGTFPVPAPATADLLRGVPTYSAHVEKELVTPTGAALVRALEPVFGPQPAMRVSSIGYGAGSRNPSDFPNVLRLSVGESSEDGTETVTVMETAIDDASPQLLAHVAEALLALGALDATLTPTVMKKGRAGTLLTVLCKPEQSAAMRRLLFGETTTLGIRVRQEQRYTLERRFVPVETEYGVIAVKLGTLESSVLNVAPEFEDCRRAATAHGVAIKVVQQAALVAYAGGREPQ